MAEPVPTVFNVEEVPLVCIRAPGHYFAYPGRKSCSHMSVMEVAIHFWKKGLTNDEQYECVRYENFGHIPNRRKAWTNVIDEIPRMPASERVKVISEGRSTFLRPEQKNVALIRELVEQYSNPGDTVVDRFAGTFSTAKACLSVEKARRFVGCDADPNCVKLSRPGVLATYAKEALRADSGMRAVGEKAVVLKEFLAHPLTAKYGNAAGGLEWSAPMGLPMYQALPGHITRFLATAYGKPEVCEKHEAESPGDWRSSLRGFLNTMDPATLVGVEASALRLMVKRSNINHPKAGRGVFAMREFGEGEVVAELYGTLVYEDLGKRKATTKTYGSGILGVRKGRFSEYSARLARELEATQVRRCEDGTEETYKKSVPVFIAPARWCEYCGYSECERAFHRGRGQVEQEECHWARATVGGSSPRHNCRGGALPRLRPALLECLEINWSEWC